MFKMLEEHWKVTEGCPGGRHTHSQQDTCGAQATGARVSPGAAVTGPAPSRARLHVWRCSTGAAGPGQQWGPSPRGGRAPHDAASDSARQNLWHKRRTRDRPAGQKQRHGGPERPEGLKRRTSGPRFLWQDVRLLKCSGSIYIKTNAGQIEKRTKFYRLKTSDFCLSFWVIGGPASR